MESRFPKDIDQWKALKGWWSNVSDQECASLCDEAIEVLTTSGHYILLTASDYEAISWAEGRTTNYSIVRSLSEAQNLGQESRSLVVRLDCWKGIDPVIKNEVELFVKRASGLIRNLHWTIKKSRSNPWRRRPRIKLIVRIYRFLVGDSPSRASSGHNICSVLFIGS